MGQSIGESLKNFLSKIILILTLDCEQSAKLTSDSFDRELNWAERLAVKLHCLICSKSRKLDRQLGTLNQALLNKLSEESDPLNQLVSTVELPESAKERIRMRLKELG